MLMPMLRAFSSPSCLLCRDACDGFLCATCALDIPHRTLRCPRCARSTVRGQVCRSCRYVPPAFDETLSATRYLFPIDRVIWAFKYGRRLELAKFFAEVLHQRNLPISRTDGLVPIPLHTSRLRQRGFNQSHEIARHLAKRTGIALMNNALIRVKDTESQTGLSYRQRRENVAEAFTCSHDVRGLRLALIDDVMTTGATMRECALVLKNKGAAHIACWVAARVGAAD